MDYRELHRIEQQLSRDRPAPRRAPTATLHVSAAGTRIPKPAALDYATPPQPRVSLDRARDAAARVAAAAGPYKRLNQKILKMKAAGK